MPELVLAIIILVLIAIVFFLFKKLEKAEQAMQEILFEKRSIAVKHGKQLEQLLPLAGDFPFAQENFRFLGNPIDGIAFEEDKIVFCEFKSGKSKLSEKQKQIRELVEKKEVEWREFSVE